MGYRVQWESEDRLIMRLTFIGRWTWEDVYLARDECHRQLDHQPHKVGFIVDWELETWLPIGHKRHMPRLVPDRHPRIRKVIYVLRNPVYRKLLMLYFWKTGGFGFQFDFADSLDSARIMLGAHEQN